jgi:2-oxoglutarate/2-oxoacid ferredoxin oxidoreductase subunit beta
MNKKEKIKNKLSTREEITWCPGCWNFLILESVKEALSDLIKSKKYKLNDFAFVTGIGCHAKIFDYLNLSGFYGLHGRVLPTALGIKIGNPKLKVLGFGGDGDTYSEGMSHFISAFRYNSDMTLIVHDNQSFSLTTGQATATSQKGFKTKVEPFGSVNEPLNPVKIALACGGTFIARCNPLDIKNTSLILKKAIEHKGFSYIEMIQKCLVFNSEKNNIEKRMYKIKDNYDYKKAQKLVEEWNYNSNKGRIPVGILYKTQKQTFEEKYYQLKNKF